MLPYAKLPTRSGEEPICEIFGLGQLKALVEQHADAAQVSALASELRQRLISGYGLSVVPAKVPDLQRGAALYAENCAACHGAEGRWDGPMAATLTPRPTDFTDVERYRERTLYGLYSTITHGLDGTAMPSWSRLPEADRWALAFHVGGLAAAKVAKGEPTPEQIQAITPEALTTRTPAEMERQMGAEGGRLVAWLRQHPDPLWHGGKGAAVDFASTKLEESR